MAYDGKDPQVKEEYDEIDEYIESQIVFNGELTVHGEKMYEEHLEHNKMIVYDEVSGEWICVE